MSEAIDATGGDVVLQIISTFEEVGFAVAPVDRGIDTGRPATRKSWQVAGDRFGISVVNAVGLDIKANVMVALEEIILPVAQLIAASTPEFQPAGQLVQFPAIGLGPSSTFVVMHIKTQVFAPPWEIGLSEHPAHCR